MRCDHLTQGVGRCTKIAGDAPSRQRYWWKNHNLCREHFFTDILKMPWHEMERLSYISEDSKCKMCDQSLTTVKLGNFCTEACRAKWYRWQKRSKVRIADIDKHRILQLQAISAPSF